MMNDPRKVEQGSDEWKMLRLGRVTASNVADVMAKGKSGEALSRKDYKIKLVAERMSGEIGEGFTNAAMEWGTAQEPFARMAYEAATHSLVDKTGFWPSDEIEWLGVSPDGLVDNDGLVEIKCPNTKTHIETIFDKRVPAKYIKQIQCQLWVTGRSWCDFVSFDPRLTQRPIFIKRVMRDDVLIAEMKEEVLAFLGEVEEMIAYLEGENNE